MKTRWILKTTVPDDHKLQIQIPLHVPSGPATVEVELVSQESERDKAFLMGDELLKSSILGMWKDRMDIGDSTAFVRQLREEEEQYRDLRT